MENNKKEIGEKGEMLNLSIATRSLNLIPDLNRIKQYDDYPQKLKKQKQKQLLWALIFLAPTVFLIFIEHPFWAIIPGILCVWNLFMALMISNVKPSTAYEQGLLIGAVISSTSPLQIVAMAEVQRSEDAPICWGLKKYTLKELPGHSLCVGERIPCAALFGAPIAFGRIWGEFEPHPACWATNNQDELKKAIEAIDETEWNVLETLVPKVLERNDIDKKYAYFNHDLSPRTDLYEKHT